MVLQLQLSGDSLGTRYLGKALRHSIEHSIHQGENVILDFSGVKYISHSFADECFAKLLLRWNLEEIQDKTTFRYTNEQVKKMISLVFAERVIGLVTFSPNA